MYTFCNRHLTCYSTVSPILVYIERPAYNLQKYETGDVINFSIPVPPHARARGARGGAPLKPSFFGEEERKINID